MSDLYVYPGFAPESVKAVGDALVVEGWLIKFTDAARTDLHGEYFTADTDFGPLSDEGTVKVGSYFDHGQDPAFGRERLGTAELTMKDEGVWARHIIRRRKSYLERYFSEGGTLGQSSGTAGHIMDRDGDQKARRIVAWPLAEASLTPEPAEKTTYAYAVKSIRIPDAKALKDDATRSYEDATKALASINATLSLAHTLRSMNASLLPLLP